jgi:hypothetical protein
MKQPKRMVSILKSLCPNRCVRSVCLAHLLLFHIKFVFGLNPYQNGIALANKIKPSTATNLATHSGFMTTKLNKGLKHNKKYSRFLAFEIFNSLVLFCIG